MARGRHAPPRPHVRPSCRLSSSSRSTERAASSSPSREDRTSRCSRSTRRPRSEEHTSELQSLTNLVCRLLLDTPTTEIYTLSLHDALPILTSAGSALMGIGHGSGETRAAEAARQAIMSPLLEQSIDGARGVLFTITGGPDLTLFEVNEAAEIGRAHV